MDYQFDTMMIGDYSVDKELWDEFNFTGATGLADTDEDWSVSEASSDCDPLALDVLGSSLNDVSAELVPETKVQATLSQLDLLASGTSSALSLPPFSAEMHSLDMKDISGSNSNAASPAINQRTLKHAGSHWSLLSGSRPEDVLASPYFPLQNQRTASQRGSANAAGPLAQRPHPLDLDALDATEVEEDQSNADEDEDRASLNEGLPGRRPSLTTTTPEPANTANARLTKQSPTNRKRKIAPAGPLAQARQTRPKLEPLPCPASGSAPTAACNHDDHQRRRMQLKGHPASLHSAHPQVQAQRSAAPVACAAAGSVAPATPHQVKDKSAYDASTKRGANKVGKRCEFCLEKFESSEALQKHRQTHIVAPNQFKCTFPDCSKEYATGEGLRLHVRNVHLIAKNWKCLADNCTRSFVRQSDLRMHIIRMHSDIRPFPCPVQICQKSFACHSELRRHVHSCHKLPCPKPEKVKSNKVHVDPDFIKALMLKTE